MSATVYTHDLDSPIGSLWLLSDGEALTGLHMEIRPYAPALDARWIRSAAPFKAAIAQLRAYFAGELRDFDLPLAAAGTPFQHKVWSALRGIPLGVTRSYGQLAQALGQPTASRAVGLANGRNPISIIVPCHRVIGAGGALTGYAGGLPRKRWLLAHEAAMASGNPLELAPLSD